MAKLRYGSIIVEARGRVGGQTLTVGQYGPTLTTNPARNNTATPAQSMQLAQFASIAALWRDTLTDAQRLDWQFFSTAHPQPDPYGNLRPLSARTLFLQINARRRTAGDAALLDPPLADDVQPLETLTLAIAANGTQTLTWTPTPTPTNHRLRIFAQAPRSPGQLRPSGARNLITIAALSTASPLDLTALYAAKFTPPLQHQKVFVLCDLYHNVNGYTSAALWTTATRP